MREVAAALVGAAGVEDLPGCGHEGRARSGAALRGRVPGHHAARNADSIPAFRSISPANSVSREGRVSMTVASA
jgi:hypothetical protein